MRVEWTGGGNTCYLNRVTCVDTEAVDFEVTYVK
jgi:hypothetical protein